MGILGTAITGINAAQLGLLTTEHNIANANTPGYTRQRTIQTTVNPVFTGSGFVGQGTRVATIERQYSAFLTNQINLSQSNASELSKYYDQVALIDNILADPSSGLSPAVQDFFRGVQQVAADPASLPARQALVSSAQALSARFQGIDSRFSEIYDGVDSQISSTVSGINSIASMIGELNQRILVSGTSTEQPANDLFDQRDQLVADLNKLIRVQVVNDPNGAYNIFIGNGQQLVVGSIVSQLGVRTSAADPSRLVVGVKTPSGTQVLPESVIIGGELGGLVRFRSESLDRSANSLGQVAASLALTVNAQHALGQDLLGQIAGNVGFSANLFSVPVPAVIGNSANAPASTLTAAFVNPPPVNADGFYTNISNSDYQLSYDGTTYTLSRLSDNTTYTSNVSVAALSATVAPLEGLTLASTSMAAGDSFRIEPTRAAARDFALNPTLAADPRLIAAAGPVRVQGGATNLGSGKVASVSVASGYSGAGLPLSLTFNAADPGHPAFTQGYFSGFPVGATVTVAQGGTTTNYTVGAAAPIDGVPFQNGATVTYNGITFEVDGLPTNNDQFVIGRNTQGVSDARNMLKLGQLQTQNTMSGASATFQSSYARLVSDVGNKSREIAVTRDAQEKLVEQASAAREAISGVNLDEEAANLIRFQQAYQASAKSFDIASRLFDEILALGR